MSAMESLAQASGQSIEQLTALKITEETLSKVLANGGGNAAIAALAEELKKANLSLAAAEEQHKAAAKALEEAKPTWVRTGVTAGIGFVVGTGIGVGATYYFTRPGV